jgi:hypothetical protein
VVLDFYEEPPVPVLFKIRVVPVPVPVSHKKWNPMFSS